MPLGNRIIVLAALASFGTVAVLSPAIAQVKAPAKSRLKPAAKADPTDNIADQLNAKWQAHALFWSRNERRSLDKFKGLVAILLGC